MELQQLRCSFIFLTLLVLHSNTICKIKGEKNEKCGIENTMTGAPNTKLEYTKRKISQDVNEFWWYLESKLENFKTGKNVAKILADLKNRQYAILSQLSDLSKYDGHNSWRIKENKELTDSVQKRLYFIQNPQNCSNAKKLLCSIDADCGFGCQFHRIVICVIISYATGRTLLLDTQNWSYGCDGDDVFEEIFQPISKNCLLHRDYELSSHNIVEWPGTDDDEIIKYSFTKNARPKFLPPMVPKDLIDRIMSIHGNPVLWWISQFVRYLWKFQPKIQFQLKESEKDFGSDAITVGIHIRRNDKIIEKECKYHPVEEYMKYAIEYFEQAEFQSKKNKIIRKQVFIASDDENVFDEIRKKYPGYKILGDERRARSASLANRYDFGSLKNLISDIHMLSQSDYIVCTLSSNVCKLAHKIQQQRFIDGSWRIHSLDSSWLNSGTLFTWRHVHKAVFPHEAVSSQDLPFDVGDTIFDVTNNKDGFAQGINMKTNSSGIFPTYKTIPVIQTYAFPTYFNAMIPKFTKSNANSRKTSKYKQSFRSLCQKQQDKCRLYDINGNGYIEKDELLRHFSSNDTIHKHSEHVDKNQDGKISLIECTSLVRTLGYRFFL